MKFNWPKKTENKSENDNQKLLEIVGSEDGIAVAKAVAILREHISNAPKTGRVLAAAYKHEFVLPLTDSSQKTPLLDSLYSLGIFPWEEDGELIIDRKRDLQKLEIAGLYTPVERITSSNSSEERIAVGDSDKEFAFPLPEIKADTQEINREIRGIQKMNRGEHGGASTHTSEEAGIDTEMRDIIDRFDQGLIDDDEPEFVEKFGNLPTLTLFPHKYIWKKGVATNRHTGEVITKEVRESILLKAKEGDQKALTELVRLHTGLVLTVLARVKNKFGGDPDDLFQEGIIALTRAIGEHDSEKGAFTTFAILRIEQRMRVFNARYRFPIDRPANIITDGSVINRATRKVLKDSDGGAFNPEEVFEYLPDKGIRIEGKNVHPSHDGVGLDRLRRALMLDAVFDPISPGEENNPIDNEQIARQNEDTQISSVESGGLNFDEIRVINKALLSLTAREERVLRLRFGLTGDGSEHFLEEVGDSLGVSKERVRQMEAKALRKLKHPSRSRALRTLMEDYY